MNQDRIAKLERKLELVAREIAGLPVALARGSRPKEAAASGHFVCTLGADIPGGNLENCGQASGTVYEVKKDGLLEELGSRQIFNPILSTLPAMAVGEQIIYPCTQIYKHAGADETEEDDQFLLLVTDVLHVLASRPGFGPKKALAVGEEGGDSATDIEWLGEECQAQGG